MSKFALAGIDIGTSKIRCVLYDIKGKLLYSCSKNTPIIKIRNLDYNPVDKIYEILKKLLKETFKSAKKNNLVIKGLSISSVGEAGVPIDKNLNPLMDIIPWYDQRTETIRDKYIKNNEDKIYKFTGLNSDHFYSVYKILWIKINKPKIYSKIYKWLPVNDYFAMKLSGSLTTDYSQAMRTLLFNPKKLNWSNEMIKFYKINKKILPVIINAGEKKSFLNTKIKKMLDLNYDCVVAAGGHDHFVGIFALGGFEKNTVVNSMGSAEALAFNTSKYISNNDLKNGKFISGIFKTKTKNSYYVVGSILTSGIVIEWFRKMFNISKFEQLNKIFQKNQNSNILFFPQFDFSHSPINTHKTKGFISGIDRSTSKSEIYMSMLKCLAFDTKNALNFISKTTNIKIKKIICSGGSVQNEYWMRLRSDIFNNNLLIDKNIENVSLGSAILAGLGSNVYKNDYEVSKMIKNKFKIIKKNKMKKNDRELYKKYNTSLKKIIEINNNL